MNNNRIIIAGGGTGGHLFPAIAIGEEIKDRFPETEIHFVGSKFGLESKVFPVKDLTHTLLNIRGFQRNINFQNIIKNISLPFLIINSYIRINALYREFKPNLIIGTGGYASAIPLMVGKMQNPKIPFILQEQNSYPGITTRWFAKHASLICSAFEIFRDLDEKKVVITGNPIRNNICDGDNDLAIKNFSLSKNRKTIFIFGGSQGSRFLNQSLSKIIKKMNFKNIQILWQTGDKEFQKYSSFSNKYIKVIPFINDMASAYSLSDLVICRSGALTISELTACGKPSILIPFAAAAGNHQLKNAKTLSEKGASLIIEERDLDNKILLLKINDLINDDDKLKSMSMASKELGNPNATKIIVDQIAKRNYFV